MKRTGVEREAIWTLIANLIMLFLAMSSGVYSGGRLPDPLMGYTGGQACSGDPVNDALSRYAIPGFTGAYHRLNLKVCFRKWKE